MARITFRQGIVRHQTDGGNNPIFLNKVGQDVNLIVSPDFTTISFIDGPKDYLFTESVTVPNAWTGLPVGVDSWLYWDLNRTTGIRTFGFTTLAPVSQSSAPASPAAGQMWFDTTQFIWKEFTGASFVPVIRVFAARLVGGNTFESMSANTPLFTGTQVGLPVTVNSGSLAFDANGNPIINQNGKFFTTEDLFTSGVPSGASLKVNNVLVRGLAQEPIGPYQVVQFSSFDKISLADPFDAVTVVYGIVERGVPTGDTANVVTDGVVFNEAWDWEAAGANINDPLYIDATGQLVVTSTIPNQVPVAAVIGKQEILFKLGIYGFGGSSAVADHSALFGLMDDDHTQYALADGSRGSFSPVVHNHVKNDISDFNDADYATAAQGTLADTAVQPTDNVSLLTNDAGYLTSYTETDPVYLAEKGQPLGTATLDASGLISNAQIPPLAITETFVVASEAAMLALSTAETGDIAIRTDLNETFILQGNDFSTISHWQKMLTPTDAVLSVDGNVGVVDLSGTYASLVHTHVEADITDLQAYLLNITGESIGALSDVDVTTTLPTDGQSLVWNNTTSMWEPSTISAGGINNVVEDITPQLGGDLDTNGSDIISIDNDINITATSSGGFGTFNVRVAAADETGGGFNGGGDVTIQGGGVTDSGKIAGGISLIPGADAVPDNPASVAIFGQGNAIGSVNDFNARLLMYSDNGGFNTLITVPSLAASTTFTLPPDDGTNGFVLTTDGAGVTTWAAAAGGGASVLGDLTDVTVSGVTNGQVLTYQEIGNVWVPQTISAGGINDVVDDISPQLGGDLDLNTFDIITIDKESTTPPDNINIIAGHSSNSGDGADVFISAGGSNEIFAQPGSITLTAGLSGPDEGAVIIARAAAPLQTPGAGHLQIESDNGNSVDISVPTLTANTTFTLPPDDGTNGFVLTTDGTGVTTWAAAAGGGSNNWITANNGADFVVAPSAPAVGEFDIAIGNNAVANGSTIGGALAVGSSATGLTSGAQATAGFTTAIGTHARAQAQSSIAIGAGLSTSNSAISIGGSEANGNYSFAVGRAAAAENADDVVIGQYAATGTGGQRSVVIGRNATTVATVDRAVVIGSQSTASLDKQIVVGSYTTAASVTTDTAFSVKIGNGQATTDKNLVHLYGKGKLELYGDEAMFVAPTYTLATLPPQVAGGMIYVSDATGATLTGSQCFSNGTVWIDVTTGIAVA